MIDEKMIEIIKDQEKLKQLKISERDILILQLRFGLIDGKEYTYKEIGKRVWSTHPCFKYSTNSPYCEISQERVRQILCKSIRKISKLLKD